MKLLAFLFALVSFSLAWGSSLKLDSEVLTKCGGTIELRKSDSNYHIEVNGSQLCKNITMKDENKNTIKSYKLTDSDNGRHGNFTLSKEMMSAANKGKLYIEVHSNSRKTLDLIVVSTETSSDLNELAIQSKELESCGGSIKFKRKGENFYLVITGSELCSNVTFEDTDGLVIKSYKLQVQNGERGGSYTLSKDMKTSLAASELVVSVHSNSKRTMDTFKLLGQELLPDGHTMKYLGRSLICTIWNSQTVVAVWVPQSGCQHTALQGRYDVIPLTWEYQMSTLNRCVLWDENDRAVMAVDLKYCQK